MLPSTTAPQADRLDKLHSLLTSLRNGDPPDLVAATTQLSGRHIDYYVDAAILLGLLLRHDDGSLSLTAEGERLLAQDVHSPDYRHILAACINNSSQLQKLAPELLGVQDPDRDALRLRIQEHTGLSASTADRRAGTLLSWRRQALPYQTSLFSELGLAATIPPVPNNVDNIDPAPPHADAPPRRKGNQTLFAENTMIRSTPKTPPPVRRTTGRDEYQGQIRPSQINQLIEKRKKQGYAQYLNKVTLANVRGFNGQEVSFDFPVTAIIGPNGGGKTTILGAAACAYSTIKPRQFFSKSGPFDSSMKDWSIEYELLDRKENPKGSVRRSAGFVSSKWSRKALSRDVLVFGVSRTVPASERADLRRCTTGKFKVGADQVSRLEPNVALAVQKILGKDVENYSHIKVDGRGKVSLLSALTPQGVKYSEFHFGAGESSIIRMIRHIEHAKEHCLILIEEIENGLHPVATIRMVEYLIEVAQRKNAQAIFTTHSNDALRPLPDEAVWASVDQTVFQGKLDVHALRAITGQVDSQLVVFVEDDFAKQWVESVLRLADPDSLGLVEVHGMHGDGMAVAVNRHHNLDPSRTGESICYIDGDSRQDESAKDGVYRLPGKSPETYIYDAVLEKIDKNVGQLAVALHQRFENQPRVRDVVKGVRNVNRDGHLLFSQVAQQLGFLSEEVVRSLSNPLISTALRRVV